MKKIIIFLGLVFWPLGLYLTNQTNKLWVYFSPALLILASFFLYKKKSKFYPLPIILIPLVDSKLALFPVICAALLIFTHKNHSLKFKAIFIFISLLILFIVRKQFISQSIFKLEYESKQKILREINLYPNPLFARIYQNKAKIISDKMIGNLLALIDPGNYFFSFHPREGILVNKNLIKYPFLAIIPFFLSFIGIKMVKHKRFFILILVSGILSLTFIEIFDESDFILWLPLAYFYLNGWKKLSLNKNKLSTYLFYLLFLLNSIIELSRIFFVYK